MNGCIKHLQIAQFQMVEIQSLEHLELQYNPTITHQLSHSSFAVRSNTLQKLKYIIGIPVNHMHSNGWVFMMLKIRTRNRGYTKKPKSVIAFNWHIIADFIQSEADWKLS